MIQRAASFNTPEGVRLIMKDIGRDGTADTPELAEFLKESSLIASEALI